MTSALDGLNLAGQRIDHLRSEWESKRQFYAKNFGQDDFLVKLAVLKCEALVEAKKDLEHLYASLNR